MSASRYIGAGLCAAVFSELPRTTFAAPGVVRDEADAALPFRTTCDDDRQRGPRPIARVRTPRSTPLTSGSTPKLTCVT
jgi:hypothetical protein